MFFHQPLPSGPLKTQILINFLNEVELINVNKMGSLEPKLGAQGPKLGPLMSIPVQWYSELKIFHVVELFDVNMIGALAPRSGILGPKLGPDWAKCKVGF